jgi:hypothetical protein
MHIIPLTGVAPGHTNSSRQQGHVATRSIPNTLVDIRASSHPPRAASAARPHDPDCVAEQHVMRGGMALHQLLRWRERCDNAALRDDLSAIARILVDNIRRKVLSPNIGHWMRNLPSRLASNERAPWDAYALANLASSMDATDHPLDLGVDASTLGTWSLAGVIIARIWSEPGIVVQPKKDGANFRFVAPPALPSLEALASASIASALIPALLTCESMTAIKAWTDSSQAIFTNDNRAANPGKIPLVDTLQRVRTIIETHEPSGWAGINASTSARPPNDLDAGKLNGWDR